MRRNSGVLASYGCLARATCRVVITCLVLACCLVLSVSIAGCGFVSFETLSLTTHPSQPNQVIPHTDSLTVEFSIEPDRPTAERLIRVSTPNGTASGDLSWEGNTVSFLPQPALPAGQRLVFTVAGDARTEDGRTFTVSVEIPFFVDTDGMQPILSSFQPAEGAVVGVSTPIVLAFSDPIDTDSFKKGFSLNPGADFTVSWSDSGDVVTITPKTQWSTLTLYQWEAGDEIKSRDGVSIDQPRSGSFLVQEDAGSPSVLKTQPAILSNGTFLPVDASLAGLRSRDCILVTLSEDATVESFDLAFSIDPGIGGHPVRVSAGLFAFVPEESYQMGRTHRLTISTDLEDAAGNRMAEDYTEWFVPAIPELSVASITPGGNPQIPSFNSMVPIGVSVPAVPGDELSFTIVFDQVFDPESKARIPDLITCEGFFPWSLLDPALRSVTWPNDTTTVLVYKGFTVSAPPVLDHYRLTILGGPAGVSNAEGSHLREDIWVVLYTQ